MNVSNGFSDFITDDEEDNPGSAGGSRSSLIRNTKNRQPNSSGNPSKKQTLTTSKLPEIEENKSIQAKN